MKTFVAVVLAGVVTRAGSYDYSVHVSGAKVSAHNGEVVVVVD